MRQHSGDFVVCLSEKLPLQNCQEHLKRLVICVRRGKKRRNPLWIASIFDEIWRELTLFQATLRYGVLPKCPLFRVSKNPQTVKMQLPFLLGTLFLPPAFMRGVAANGSRGECKSACYARHFDLLRNSPLSSIHIHFGVELLVLAALVTSASLSKISFLTD